MAKRKNKKRFRRLFTSLLLAAIVFGTVLSLFVFFKIEMIEVSNESIYTDEQIVAASGLSTGDNLIRFISSKSEQRICSELPYIESAKIKRVFPNKLVITVAPVRTDAVIVAGESKYVIDKSGKLLDTSDAVGGASVLLGVAPAEGYTAKIGEPFVTENEAALGYAKQILCAAEELGLSDKLTVVDVGTTLDIMLVYDKRVAVIFGTYANIESKLRMLREIVVNREAANYRGTVNLSTAGEGIASDLTDKLDTYAQYIG